MDIKDLHEIFLVQNQQLFKDVFRATEGSIFIGLSNDKFTNKGQGNKFAEMAVFEKKCSYAIIDDQKLKGKHENDKRFIVVDNCNEILLELAKFHRNTLKIPIIAVVGSNGKTTTKELVSHILSQKYKVRATFGNRNNHFGVCLNILAIESTDQIGVIEIGAKRLNEIYNACEIAKPGYGIVTNCGKDHLDSYNNENAVIQSNTELYNWLEETDGLAFINTNDPVLMQYAKNIKRRLYYGLEKTEPASFFVSGSYHRNYLSGFCNILIENNHIKSNILIGTNLFGAFWINTILASIVIGIHFDIKINKIKDAIENYNAKGMLRSERYKWKGNDILLDCYNANPSSMIAFIKESLHLVTNKKKYLILGAMLDVGENSIVEHSYIIEIISQYNNVTIFLVGTDENKDFEIALKLVENTNNINYFRNWQLLKHFLEVQQIEDSIFLVKGDRWVYLELIFDYPDYVS